SITPSAPGSLYGSGTFGGAISMDNKANWKEKQGFSLSSEYGSWDHQKYSLSGELGTNKIKTSLKGFYHQATNDYQYLDDAKRNPTIERRKNNDVMDYGLMSNTYWKPSARNKFETGIWYQVKHKSLPALIGTSGTEENQKDSIFRVYTKWKHVFDNSSLQVKTGYFNHSQLYTKKGSGTDDSFMVYSPIKTNKWLNDLNYKVYLSDHITFDVGAQYSLLSAKVDAYDTDIQNSNRLAFIGAIKVKYDKFNTNFSIRQQFNNETDPKTQYSIGGNYKLIKDKLFIRGNFSTKFRLPTFNERYWPELGDPDIKPEEGYSAETGLSYVIEDKGVLRKFSTDLTAYYLKIKNYILWVPENSVYYAKNLNQIFSRGIEFSTNARFSLEPVSIYWKGTYNLTRSTNIGSDNEDVNGKQLRYTPLNRAKQYINVNYKKYSLAGSWNFTGLRYTTKEHLGFSLPAYSIFNAYMTRKVNYKNFSGSIQLKVKNLFDKQYQVVRGYPMPGRGYYIKINVKFNK
ncbi:MAG: TonB-dependent receptor, partial [Bacteroidota bacterium]